MAKSARLGVIWAGSAQNSLDKGRHRGSRSQIWEISPYPAREGSIKIAVSSTTLDIPARDIGRLEELTGIA
jgi:hypothetical protein